MTSPMISRAQQRRARQRVYRRRQITAIVVIIAVIALMVLVVTSLTGGSGKTATTPTTHPAGSPTTTSHHNPVTIAAVGDTELGNIPVLPSDPASILQPIQSALAAPIVFGNLEGTMTTAASSKCAGSAPGDCYAFAVPPSYGQVMHQAGFTVLNSANNHSHDFGDQGVTDTSNALSAAGIVQAGLPGQIGIVTEGNTKVAFVDFAPYTNVNDLLSFGTAAQLIAKAKSEAQVVVVYMHAGAEGETADHVTGQEEYYVGEDRGNPEAFAHAAINDGADLVLASGPHVLRGMQWYGGHLIAYSLGDFANYQNFASVGDLTLSAILHVTLEADGTYVSGHFTSVVLSSTGTPSVDPSGQSATFVNQLSSADFGASAATINADGSISGPPAPSVDPTTTTSSP